MSPSCVHVVAVSRVFMWWHRVVACGGGARTCARAPARRWRVRACVVRAACSADLILGLIESQVVDAAHLLVRVETIYLAAILHDEAFMRASRAFL